MDAEPPATLAPGLYVVSTPIGAARDITLRALDILASADVLAAEDTRTLRRLMGIHGIALGGRMLVAYHDHSSPQALQNLLGALAKGRSVALVSEAGTPLLADPGFRLVQRAIAGGHSVSAAPGASALLAALSVAGLPTDRFLFAGFLPPKPSARARALAEISEVPATIVFYESPRRLASSLAAMAVALGPERPAAVARELTKRFEEVRRGGLGELAAAAAEQAPPKGEIVVLVGPAEAREPDEAVIDAALRGALSRLTLREAATEVAQSLGLARREAYARALVLRDAEAGRDDDER